MNNEQFDRILHSKLANHQVTPPPDVWAGIENKRFKRYRFIWWFSTFVLIFLSVVLYLLLPSGKSETASSNSHKEYAQSQVGAEVTSHNLSTSVSPVAGEAQNQINSFQSYQQPVIHQQPVVKQATMQSPGDVFPATMNPVSNFPENLSAESAAISLQNLLWLDQVNFDLPLLNAVSATSKPFANPSMASNLSMVITAGPLFAEKNLDSKFNHPNDKKYILYRQEAETRNSAWSASALLQIDLSKHFFIRTGFNYMSISEKIVMRYVKAQVEGVITDTIVGTRNEVTSPEQLLAVSDDNDFTLLADYTLRDKAEYRFASFPLLAGVTYDKSKFSFYASAGLALHFTSSYAGKILAPDSAYLFSIQNPATSPFNQLTGFTLMGSAGIGFKVSDKFTLLFEPSYFRQLPDITKYEYRLSQRFSGYGLQAGVIYKL